MAIYRIFKKKAFEPDEILILSAAYEDALSVLRLSDRQDPITEIVARKIIEAAQSGERNTRRIRDQALRELGTPPRRL
jgi:hypothetical protein